MPAKEAIRAPLRLGVLILVLAAAVPASAQLRAGAAMRDVTPDLQAHAPVYIAGFGNNRVATKPWTRWGCGDRSPVRRSRR